MVPTWDMQNESSELNLSHVDPRGSVTPVNGLSRTGHNLVAVCLGCILVLGSVYNSLVLVIFVKFESIRTPINMILLNISVSDLLVCIFGTPFSFASNVSGVWLLGPQGCKWYGFCNSLFGLVSLVSLSLLSYERYLTVLRCTKADMSDYKKSWICIIGSWCYSLIWTLPPLFGWSSYGLERSGTTCSVVWHSKSTNNISYIVCLFLFCLVLPLLVMIYCYGHIVKVIRGDGRISRTASHRREQRLLFMVVCMVTCYLLCWMPYGLISLITTFGKPGIITPTISIIPSILAKSSTFINPLIYIFMNKQFYRCFVALIKCKSSLHYSDNVFSSRHSRDVHAGEKSTAQNTMAFAHKAEIEEEMSFSADYLFLRRVQKCMKGDRVEPSLLDCKEVVDKFRNLMNEVTKIHTSGGKHEMLRDEPLMPAAHTGRDPKKPKRGNNKSSFAEQDVNGKSTNLKADIERSQVAAHLVGEQKNSRGVLQWVEKGYSSLCKQITYTNGTLKVEIPGIYYVYSQVSFCSNSTQFSRAPFMQYIYLSRPYETHKLLLRGANTFMSPSPDCALHSIQQGAVFELKKNDQLFVNVTDPSRINYSPGMTYFGMFKL
ncbi:CD40 ligand [Rhinophrynus dorsalis]